MCFLGYTCDTFWHMCKHYVRMGVITTKRKEFNQEMSVEETVCAVVAGSTIAVATLFVAGMLVLIIIDKRKENKNESKGRN